MSGGWRRWAAIALIGFAAAFAGVGVGRLLFAPKAPQESEIHALLHNRLGLDDAQKAKLAAIEMRFKVRRRALELELRADNARLADAIEAEHGYGPRVAEAVDRSHRAMGELQKETLAHIFEMRQLLRADQAERFDAAVVRALTEDQRGQ